MIIASSNSSDTSTAVFPDARRAFTMISLESTSSFFCSSPWTFVSPANPTLRGEEARQSGLGGDKIEQRETYRLMSRAFLTFVAMNLDVSSIALRSNVRSPVAAGPRRSWSLRIWLEY